MAEVTLGEYDRVSIPDHGASTCNSSVAALCAHNLKRTFGGVVAVNDVSFALPRAEITALIGPNGAGKSSLFNVLCGQVSPESGHTYASGREVTGLPAHRLARLGFARMYQEGRLFPDLSSLDNVSLYAQQAQSSRIMPTLLAPWARVRDDRRSRNTAMDALELMGIAHLAHRPTRELNFAFQRLVGLARLIAMEAEIYFLDEPASGLDQEGREVMITKIAELAASGATICLVEHNLDVVRQLSHRVIFMHQGAIIANDDRDAVFSLPQLAEIYFGYHD